MTEAEFRKMVRSHDYYYEYSDDYRVWERGRAEKAALRAAMKELPEGVGERIWEEEIKSMYSEYTSLTQVQ